MSVVGFDIGNLNTVIAVARNRGVDVICNEVSNRATPSLASFGAKQRYLGEQAKTQEVSNYKNTVGSLKRLLGHVSQEDLEKERLYSGADMTVDSQGVVHVNVQYLDQIQDFSYTQLMAMFLSKLKEITESELKMGVVDVVVGVPVWFTESQRRALKAAAQIAGLNVLRLINDITAAGLQWGITRELPETEAKHVAFVDVGNSDFTVQIASYVKGKMTVKACAFDRNLGGRDLDQALLTHFVEEFKEKYKMDVSTNPKALFRLRSACERVKKVMSANLQSPLNVECLMNDKDVSSMVDRPYFEELIAPVVGRITPILQAALDQSGLKVEDISSVELIGGTTRVPLVKSKITEFFGKEPSTTLNQDECVAKGCAFMCAILSPVFRVREFKIEDISVHPIKFQYPATKEGDPSKELLAFPVNSTVPSTKILTFSRKESFDIEAFQNNLHIGKYTVKIPSDLITDDKEVTVKVKARVDADSLLDVGGAHVVVEVPVEAEAAKDANASTAAEGDKMDVESPADPNNPPEDKMEVDPKAATAPTTKKVKKDLKTIVAVNALSVAEIENLRSSELNMCSSDKLVIDTDNARNSLEEYIYDIRGKVESSYSEFCQEAVKEKLVKLCEETEEWLYSEEGELATKGVYLEKLESLKKDGNAINARYLEAETFPSALSSFEQFVATQLQSVQASIMKEEAKTEVKTKFEEKQKHIAEQVQKDASKPKYENRTFTATNLNQIRDELQALTTRAINKALDEKRAEDAKKEKEAREAAAAAAKKDKDATSKTAESEPAADENSPVNGTSPVKPEDEQMMAAEEPHQQDIEMTVD